jgi:hypothetical protein
VTIQRPVLNPLTVRQILTNLLEVIEKQQNLLNDLANDDDHFYLDTIEELKISEARSLLDELVMFLPMKPR